MRDRKFLTDAAWATLVAQPDAAQKRLLLRKIRQRLEAKAEQRAESIEQTDERGAVELDNEEGDND